MAGLIPTPDIEPNLRPIRHRHASMNRFFVTPPISIKIAPEHRRSLSRLERHAFHFTFPDTTLNELAPSVVSRHVQPREIGATTRTIRGEVHHKRAHPPTLFARRRPVVMVCIVPADVIALGPEALDERLCWPALEGKSAMFDTLHRGIAVDERFFGFADGGVGRFYALVEDGGDLPFGFTVVLRLDGHAWSGWQWSLSPYIDQMVCFGVAQEAINVDHERSRGVDVDVVVMSGTLQIFRWVYQRLGLCLHHWRRFLLCRWK